ncbi:NRDE family protein [Marinobacter sp. CHS3-4]|uniref:NRDE family protein n=1 Tax=Marinobacter sp. CHS3-4 TaxID=3045174 RepID=UPI0024B56CCF|nr:NRDE family protein [Marinobacter sp. CHS3-4]MDI9246246.1 NRDE family protein [Marinobacter sp. CHS3-4]
MCLIVFSVGRHPEFPLVMAANRDEFFRRPTAAMDWWYSDTAGSEVLAGRDLQSGGTWLAVNAQGVVSAVTNVREANDMAAAHSRGELPLMAQALSTQELNRRLSSEQDHYAGFNLVRVDPDGGWYFSNRAAGASNRAAGASHQGADSGREIHHGIYGLSNHLLQTPWPKLLRLRRSVGETLEGALENNTDEIHDSLIGQLQDTTPAPDDQLPDTGVGLATERFLSSPFIKSEEYGTRATTIVTVGKSGRIQVTEQSYGPNGEKSERRQFHWQRTA